jgi:hypothetical protein
MKLVFAIAAALLLCSACAQGGPPAPSGDSGITMYGTIDEGISYHSK